MFPQEDVKIDARLVRLAARAEDPGEAVVALIVEKAKAVDLVIQQNRRLIEEIMKRQLSEIRAEVVEVRKTASFLEFSLVCPEPVLAK